MDSSEPCDSNRRSRRRDDDKRRRVEAAVEKLIRRYGLSSKMGQELSDGIYGLYRDLVAQKSLNDQDREYRKTQRRAEQELAVRTANASGTDTNVSAYVADTREFAARMIRLESLERRNLGRGRAIEQASKITWNNLSPQERRRARQYLEINVLSGDKTRQPAREVDYLMSVADLIEQVTGHRIRFSSNQATEQRHHGVEFGLLVAAAEMADYPLSNEAMARRIRRSRR